MTDSFATPWTVVPQAPLSMEFSWQESWSGLLFSSPGDLPDSGIKPISPALAGGVFTTEPRGEAHMYTYIYTNIHIYTLCIYIYVYTHDIDTYICVCVDIYTYIQCVHIFVYNYIHIVS